MAKKKSTKSSKSVTKYEISKVLAFVTLIVSAIIWLLVGVGLFDNLGRLAGILTLVKDVALLATLGLVAHNFAKSLGKVWYIIYWVIIIVAIVGIVFGFTSVI